MKITRHILQRKECYLSTKDKTGINTPTFITIHETSIGIEKAPANRTIDYYTNLLEHPELKERDPRIAFHFLCGDDQVVQYLPTNVRTAHSGTYEGNSSIAIERLVNINIDFDKAINNQAKLAASLMDMWNIPLEHVVPHKFWSGKECPARLLAGAYGWNWTDFLNLVKAYFDKKDFFTDIL